MANTVPVNDQASVTELMLEKARQAHPRGPRLFPIGALTRGLGGRLLAPMSELAKAGCVAVSNDGVPVADTEIFRRAMEYAADFGLRVIASGETAEGVARFAGGAGRHGRFPS